MNRFYEVILENNESKRKLDLFVGDQKMETDIGCFEALFVIDDENQIKKMECNFLLDCPLPYLLGAVVHPSLIYVNLPKDLLQRAAPYRFSMNITECDCIDPVSRFTKRLDGTAGPSTISFSANDLGLVIEEQRSEIRSYKQHMRSCGEIYETIELPEVNKFRCRKFSRMQDETAMKHSGWYFSFHTSVPSILQHITYNNFNQCPIQQVHGGSGDNQQQFQ